MSQRSASKETKMDDAPEEITRSRKMSEKGEHYQIELLGNQCTKLPRKIDKTLAAVTNAYGSGLDAEVFHEMKLLETLQLEYNDKALRLSKLDSTESDLRIEVNSSIRYGDYR